jgi:hypothetical protein
MIYEYLEDHFPHGDKRSHPERYEIQRTWITPTKGDKVIVTIVTEFNTPVIMFPEMPAGMAVDLLKDAIKNTDDIIDFLIKNTKE